MLQPLVEALKLLNTKNAGKIKPQEVLKLVIDDEYDEVIDAAFPLGGALFVTATHYTVASTLFRRGEEYAKASGRWVRRHIKKGGVYCLSKNMMTKACIPGKQHQVAKVRPAKRLLLDLESDDDDDEDEDDDVNVGASTSHQPHHLLSATRSISRLRKFVKERNNSKHF